MKVEPALRRPARSGEHRSAAARAWDAEDTHPLPFFDPFEHETPSASTRLLVSSAAARIGIVAAFDKVAS